MSLFLMILFGFLFLLFVSGIIWAMLKKDLEKRYDVLTGFIISAVLISIPFVCAIGLYCEPHHDAKPEIEDFPKEACMDTIYHHHDGKTYVRYELRWKDDKVWED